MQYRAFLSYCREDERVARWLHGRLDNYRTPKDLAGSEGAWGPAPPKLHPIFRDRTDMSGGGELSARIGDALKNSDNLIVLCSPAAAASAWVNQEVVAFLSSERAARIFPVIAPGLPDTDDVEGDFFPPALRGRGLLAADLREIKQPSGKIIGDGREGGRLKLLSGLLGLRLDQLAQRERRRQRFLFAGASVAACCFAGVAVAALWFAHDASSARDSAYEALGRGFAESGWSALDDSNYLLAVKYAVSGSRIAPAYGDEFRALMARVAHDLWEKEFWSTADDPLSGGLSISSDQNFVALLQGDRCEVRRLQSWELVSSIAVCTAPDYAISRIAGLNVVDGEVRLLLWHRFPTPAGPPGSDIPPERTNQAPARLTLWDGMTGDRLADHPFFGDSPYLLADGQSVAYVEPGIRVSDLLTDEAQILTEAPSQLVVSSTGEHLASREFSGARTHVWDLSGRDVFQREGNALCLSSQRFIIVVHAVGELTSWNFRTGERVGSVRAGPRDIRQLYGDCSVMDASLLPATHARDNELAWSADGRFAVLWEEYPLENQRAPVDLASNVAPVVRMTASGIEVASLTGHASPVTEDGVFSLANGFVTTDHSGTTIYHKEIAPSLRMRTNISGVSDSIAGYRNGLLMVGAVGGVLSEIDPRVAAGQVSRGQVQRVLVVDGRAETLPPLAVANEVLWTSAIGRNGTRLAAGAGSGRVYIWDQDSGRLLRTIAGHGAAVEIIAFASDDRILTADASGRVSVLDADSGAEVAHLNVTPGREAGPGFFLSRDFLWDDGNENNLAVTNDLTVIATANDTRTITLWDVGASRELRRIESDARVSAIEFSSDGRYLISGHEDGQIRVWNTSTGELQSTLTTALRMPISAITISESGRLIASGDRGGLVRIWDAATGRQLMYFEDDDGPARMLGFSADGALLLSVNQRDTLHVRAIHGLDLSSDDLMRRLCAVLRAPSARHFSATEVASDPAIREVWLRRQPQRNFCEHAED